MAEALTLQGKLEAVPELLRTMLGNQGIASLTLKRDGTEIVLYFENGRILHATTTDPDLGLADVLLSHGDLSLDQYLSIQEQLRKRASAVEALTCAGTLSPDELLHAFDLQAQEILQEAFRWTSGTYTMVLEDHLPPNIIPLKLHTERLVIQAVRNISRYSVIRRGLGPLHRMFMHRAGQDSRLYQIELTDEENHIFSLLETPRSIHEVCGMSYLPNIETLRVLWALWVVRLLEEGKVQTQKDQAQEEEFTLGALVESYNNAFARIYELVYQELGEETMGFTAEVYSRLSGDARQYLEASALSEEGRLDYDTLMHTLSRRHVANRSQVLMDLMNEILYAWVLQVRLRFGEKLQAEVDKTINEIREE